MKIATVCSGIGSPEQALKNIGIPHEVVFACEIDKYARASYLAMHSTNVMYEDMTKEQWDKPDQYSDLFIGGIPCQAFSLAGKRLGELDPRGLLFFDFYRYVKNQQPKVFIIENVKGLLSDNKGKTFQNWLLLLGDSVNGHRQMFNHPDSLGYNLHHTVMNTKDFGLPQNRERVFIVGIRQDLPNTFRFPKGWKLDKRLKDVLETEVDEKYYLSDKMLNGFLKHGEKSELLGRGFKFQPIKNTNTKLASTVTARCFKMGVDDNYIQEPICVAMRGRNPDNPSDRTAGNPTEQRLEPNSQGITNTITSVQKDNLILLGSTYGYFEARNRVYSSDGISPTITAKQGGGHEPKTNVGSRIRRLTPLETWRLQGFPDEQFYKAKEVNSDTQLYKQAGNSISVSVMQAILENVTTLLQSTN